MVTNLEPIDFQPYLRSLIATYEQWWQRYTLTEAIGQTETQDTERHVLFDFGLMVQNISNKRDRAASETIELQENQEKTERLPVLEGIRKYADDHVVLMGRPGSGKSTALIRLLLEMATQTLEQGEGQIPVLVELRYWQISIVERIQAFLFKHDPHLALDESTLITLLRQGQFLLLIDGLNELPSDEARRDVARFETDFAKAPMIFTTRELSLGGELGLEKKLEMQPLTEAQMRQFVDNYLGEERGEQLLRQLQNRLRELGQTPLLLAMLCSISTPEQTLPTNLGEVFRQFTQFYERRLKGDVPDPYEHRDDWAKLLQCLAFAMMQGPDPQNQPTELSVAIPQLQAERVLTEFLQGREPYPAKTAERCLNDLLKHHLIQPNGDQIEFRHQLIQEYYAAEQLLGLLPELSDEELKRNYLNYLKWTEAIALMLSLVDDEGQALRVVKLAMDDVDLMLGARLTGKLQSRLQAKGLSILMEKFTKTNPEQPAWLKLKLLETIGADVVVEELGHLCHHASHNIRSTAYLVLLEIAPKSIPKESRAYQELEHVREILRTLPEHQNTKNRKAILDPQVVDNLVPPVRSVLDDWVSEKLSSDEVVSKLIPLLSIENWKMQWNAVKLLCCLETEKVVPVLLQVIEDPKSLVVDTAARQLGKLKVMLAVPKLIGILHKHPSPQVRSSIIDALCMVRSNESISWIFQALKDEDIGVRHTAAQAFKSFDSEEMLPGLIATLSHSDFYIRRLAASRIRRLSLKDNIAQLLNQKYLHTLIQALEHRDVWVRWRIVFSLWNIATEEVIPLLRKKLEHQNPDINLCASLILGKFSCKEAVSGLMQMMEIDNFAEHPDGREIPYTAAYALGIINDSVVTEYLPQLNALVGTQTGEDALRAIRAIQNRFGFYNYNIAHDSIPPGKTIYLYFSYDPADEALLNQLTNHLNLLERQGIITSWSKRELLGGDESEQSISQQLNIADIILLLISPNSLADDTCYNLEIRPVMKRHQAGEAHVIPILMRPVAWAGASFRQLDLLPKNHQPVTFWDNQDGAFREIAEGIRQVAMEMRRGQKS